MGELIAWGAGLLCEPSLKQSYDEFVSGAVDRLRVDWVEEHILYFAGERRRHGDFPRGREIGVEWSGHTQGLSLLGFFDFVPPIVDYSVRKIGGTYSHWGVETLDVLHGGTSWGTCGDRAILTALMHKCQVKSFNVERFFSTRWISRI